MRGTCARNMRPNAPAPIRPTRTGRPAAARAASPSVQVHAGDGSAPGIRFTNTLSSAARSPIQSAPASTAASPRLDTSTRGG